MESVEVPRTRSTRHAAGACSAVPSTHGALRQDLSSRLCMYETSRCAALPRSPKASYVGPSGRRSIGVRLDEKECRDVK
jgi:hypothetical protein